MGPGSLVYAPRTAGVNVGAKSFGNIVFFPEHCQLRSLMEGQTT
jgi:hypothetical protein